MTRPEDPSSIRRALRHLLSTIITLLVVTAAGGAVYFSAGAVAQRANAIPAPDPAPALPVAVQPIRWLEGYTVQRQFTGQVEAAFTTELSFEIGGRLVEVSVQEGDSVQAGGVIARLDTALLKAEQDRLVASRAAIEDQFAFAESRLNRAVALNGRGFASQEMLDQAQATHDELRNRLIEMDAALNSIRISIEKSVLTAPFDGRIGARNVDNSETLSAGQPVVALMDTSTPEVRVGLPLDIDPTDLATTQILVGNSNVPATLRQMRPDLDPVTRTRTALFTLKEDLGPTIGETATLLLPIRIRTPGVWVPLNALQEGAGSVWTIMVVEDDRVRAAAVELLHIENDQAYVRGSFTDTSQFIGTGAHRVVVGQRVAPVPQSHTES